MSKIVIIEGPNPGETIELDQDEMVIGRSPDSDIVIAFKTISGRHARITRLGTQFFIEDLHSSNGTFLNGRPVEAREPLIDGDEIRFSRSIVVRFEAPEFAAPSDLPLDATLVEEFDEPSPWDSPLATPSPSAEPATLPENRRRGAEPSQPPATPSPVGSPALDLAAAAVEKATMVQGDGDEAGQQKRTMLQEDYAKSIADTPPQLEVTIAGAVPVLVTLDRPRMTLGRAEDNDIIIPSKIVSRRHALLERIGDGYQLVPSAEAGNPVTFEGRPVERPLPLRHRDKLRIGGLDPGSMVTMTYLSPREAAQDASSTAFTFGEKTLITIGRDPTNDIVLDTPSVSRFHAQVERIGQRYRVTDLRSSNGTFVNNVRIDDEAWLRVDDTIRIGPHRFTISKDRLAQHDESGNLRVDAVKLNKWVRKDLNILQDISVVFQPREFIVVVGQSGGGKSTLVDAIAGYRPATHGDVFVNDINVYQNFDAIRDEIGYVPQRDIIHSELTAFQALDYAGQLRMPPDTTTEERHRRVNEVLEELDLAHRKDVQISGLSGGQQKRVSIGVELLTKPGLFFLDEPTSGLDPGTETALMQLMRRLADQGRTIVLITHATKNVMLADKVVFLARGGYLAWFGPPEEALAYFDQFRSERDRRAREIEFDEIYNLLDDPKLGSAPDWAERYRKHEAYQKYIVRPLEKKQHQSTGEFNAVAQAAPGPKRERQVSSLRQLRILSSRNLKILSRDRFSLILMLVAPPIVSLLDVVLAFVLGRNPFAFADGAIADVMITLFLLTIYGVMVGGLSQMREIVKEQDVYKRERLVNLRLFPYVTSKVWVAVILAIYASLIYMGVHYLAFDMPGGQTEFILMFISLALCTMAGMMLGLFASALAPNANAAPLIVAILILPQIVLGGALVPLPEQITVPFSTRWAFQAFMGITGVGSDVAADACWLLPEEERNALTPEFKDANCRCMGVNALRQESCNFPGLGQFYHPAIDEPEPQVAAEEPPVQPQPPADPVLPPQPQQPEPSDDPVVQQQRLQEFTEALNEWQAESERIRSEHEAQLEIYRANLRAFESELAAFEERQVQGNVERQQWIAARTAAVLPAEALIRQFQPGFGWTFVDKNDSSAYWQMLVTTWVAQLVIIVVLFLAILFLMKRKDVVK